MKRNLLFLLFFSLSLTIAAQTNNVQYALMNVKGGHLDKAKAFIDEACIHESTKNDAKTWYYAAIVYYRIGQSNKYQNIAPDWMAKVQSAVMRCNELDNNGEYEKDLADINYSTMYMQCVELNKSGKCADAVEKAEKALAYYIQKGDTGKKIELEGIIEGCGSNSQGELSSGNENIKRGDKKYNGEFSISGIGFSNSGTQKGNAQYYYKDALDGTRIYEGEFLYTFEDRYNSDIVKGTYLNNRQVGTWYWVSKSGDNSESQEKEVEINFNDNGKLDGAFKFSYNIVGKHTMDGHKWTKWVKSVSGDFVNGRLKRLYYWSREDHVEAEGYFSTIDAGTPVGKWKVTGEKVPNSSVTIEFDNRGNIISAVYFDPTTGDKHRVPEWICRYPESIYKDAINIIRRYCYRDTEQPK